jgi:hypothetical protein
MVGLEGRLEDAGDGADGFPILAAAPDDRVQNPVAVGLAEPKDPFFQLVFDPPQTPATGKADQPLQEVTDALCQALLAHIGLTFKVLEPAPSLDSTGRMRGWQ